MDTTSIPSSGAPPRADAAPRPRRTRTRGVPAGLACCLALLPPSLLAGERDEFAAAVRRYEERRYSEARGAFQDLAQARPADPDVRFYLGRIALWFDERDAALAHLEEAARLAPQSARVQNALGDAYGLAAQQAPLLAKLGWARKCRAAYDRAVELEPGNPAFRWSRMGFCLVAPRLAGGGMDRAEAEAAAIARLDEMNGRIARATLALATQRYAAAFAEFEPVLRDHPQDFMALYHVGRCAALSGREIDRGIRALRQCLDLPPPPGDGLPTHACVRYRLGNLLERKGDLLAARAEYARAQELHPDFRPAKIQLKN